MEPVMDIDIGQIFVASVYLLASKFYTALPPPFTAVNVHVAIGHAIVSAVCT